MTDSAALATRPIAMGASELKRAAARGCLAVLVASGGAIAVAGAAPHSAIVFAGPTDAPGWMAGPLAGSGVRFTAAQFYIAVGVMAAAYAGLIVLRRTLDLRWVVGAVVVLHAAFMLAPPLLSTDVFNYVDYARLGALHGLDPYAAAPAAVPHDAIYRYVRWRSTPSAYGPLFTLGSYPLAHLSPAGAVWTFKVVAAVASLGCVALVWRIATVLGRSQATAIAIFGLNPLLLVWTVGGAHNDLLMLAGLLAGVALTISSRERGGGAALAVAAAIKGSALVAAPFLILGARRRLRSLAGFAATMAVALAVAAAAFQDHAIGLLQVLRHEQRLVAFDGIPEELAHLAGLAGATAPVRTACGLVLVLALAWLVVRVLRGADWIAACGWALVALVALSSWFLAWYTVWPLALAAVARDRRLLVATLALQAYFVVNHLSPLLG